MKIEKLNENQIRCTLTREDLEKHKMRLTELAYGTDKAKQLFRDMMQQAQIQCGFEADNTPLMIEAVPVSMDSIVLIITKVEDPEELDTRFSKFAPYKDKPSANPVSLDGADNIIDIFQKLMDAKMKSVKAADPTKPEPSQEETTSAAEKEAAETEVPSVNLILLYSFRTLDHVIRAARALQNFFQGKNILYKLMPEGTYQLVLHQSDVKPEDFNKICNILSEYGRGRTFTSSGEAYLIEHGELITENALQTLSQL